MDTETQETPGLIGRGKTVVKLITGVVAVVAAAGWIGLGVGLFIFKVPQETGLVLALIAAFATEALMWSVAALLGLSVVEARKRIWRRLTGRKPSGV